MSELALKLIREAKEKRLTRLDLGRCELTEIPKELFELAWLEELTLSNQWIEYTPEISKWEQKKSTNNGSWNNIRRLPSQMKLLSHLKKLNLSGNEFSDATPLTSLKNIIWLNLSDNQFNDIIPLNNLTDLCWLDLSGNQLTNIVPLRSLTSLHSLFLKSNRISSITLLTKLKNLRLLSLRSNYISDISSVVILKKLQLLDLRHNRVSDITPLTKLTSLTSLYLPGNPIADISPLAKLSNLKSLQLMGINIGDINPLATLSNLTSLDLMGTGINRIDTLSKLIKLNSLDLRSNKISDVAPLSKLINLSSLDLRNNEIRDIKPIIHLIKASTQVQIDKKSQGTMIDGNPIENPPPEVIEQGNEAILAYFRSLEEQGSQQLNEAKLIIVGEPEAGKTTLMETLLNPDFELTTDTESTLGVTVHEGWQFPHPYKENITFTTNIWDFGGQQIQYMTHQFFLTPGAVYALVSANDRKETTANFRYWFKIIHLLGEERGQYSPVLVIQNDKNGQFINQFDLSYYQKHYPDLQIESLDVDLSKRDARFLAVREKIQSMLTQLPHVTTERPARWEDIRTTLHEHNQDNDHIDFNQYAGICRQHSVEREQDQRLLSSYLHQLGSLLHFADDPTLYNFIILNPQWAVDAVYSVLDDNEIKRNGGYFTREQLEAIWGSKTDEDGQPRYNHDERCKLLNLMEKEHFEICYPLDSTSGAYIAPQLLNPKRPDYEWNAADCLRFRFQYSFMPEGIITRLIVRLNALIKTDKQGKELVWHKGAVFRSEGCRAQVFEDENHSGQNVIDIAVTGQTSERKYLLREIRNEIQNVHKKWFRNIRVEQMIPCNCSYCSEDTSNDPKYFKFSILQRAQQRGKSTVECDKEFLDVSVTGLLEGVFTPNDIRQQQGNIPTFHENQDYPDTETIDIFISYSTKNRIYAAQLAQYLENSGYSVWWDTNLLAGDHFRSEIQEKLVAARCTVVLWSEHAVKSEWVQEEAGYAHSEKKLVPTKLDTTKLPMPFGGLQTISLENWHGDQNDPCLTPLLHAIKKKMEK